MGRHGATCPCSILQTPVPMILDARTAHRLAERDPRARSAKQPSPAAQMTRKLADLGPAGLDTADLLFLLLTPGRSGASASEAAEALAARFRLHGEVAWLRSLAAADVCEVAESAGIGRAAAARVTAAMELGRRAAEERLRCRTRMTCARDIYDRMHLRLRDLPQEEMWVVALNLQNEVVRETLVTRGVLDATMVHAREIFRPAVLENAASICLVHNHPSGEPSPSPEDRVATWKMMDAGRVLGIEVVDHVIIGDGHYYSFHEDGTLMDESERPAPEKPPRAVRSRRASPGAKRPSTQRRGGRGRPADRR